MTHHHLRFLTVWQCITKPVQVVHAVRLLVRMHDSDTRAIADLRTESEVLRHEHGKLVMSTKLYSNVTSGGGN